MTFLSSSANLHEAALIEDPTRPLLALWKGSQVRSEATAPRHPFQHLAKALKSDKNKLDYS